MINLTEKNNRITVTPIACPVFSGAIYAAGGKPLAQVRIAGLEKPKVYKVLINIYGLSKAGFFIERTTAFSGELVCDKDSDTAYFDFTSVPLLVKREFFANLKAPVSGKLCVEVTVDGAKYMGDVEGSDKHIEKFNEICEEIHEKYAKYFSIYFSKFSVKYYCDEITEHGANVVLI